MLNSSPLLNCYFLFSSVLSVSIIPSDFFKSSMCSLQFSSDVRTVHPTYNVVAGRGFIASVKQCSVVREKLFSQNSSWINTVSELKAPEILFCNGGMLYSANTSNSLDPVTEIYGMGSEQSLITPKDYCKHDVSKREAVLTVGSFIFSAVTYSGKAIFAKHNTITGTTLTTNYGYMSGISNYYLLFQNSHFVYAIYSDNTDTESAYISRVCVGDVGEEGMFISYVYSKLQCIVNHKTSHRVIIDAYYDSNLSRLFVLFTRQPREFSASVMCSFSLDEINETFNTGYYSYYSKTGEKKTAKGSPITCGKSRTAKEKSLVYLEDQIQSKTIIFTKLISYTMFDAVRNREGSLYFYLSNGKLIDVWLEKENITKQIQTIFLPTTVSRLYLYSSQDTVNMFLVSGDKVLFGSVEFCGHIQDPYECYSDDNPTCVWSKADWKCIPAYKCPNCSDEARIFSTHFPTGLQRTTQDFCVIKTENYPALKYTVNVTYQNANCPTLNSPPNTIIKELNYGCEEQTVFRCTDESELISGDLTRTCKSNGDWTGIQPVCQLKQCSQIGAPAHGYVNVTTSRQVVGTIAHFSCENCYEISGPKIVTCNKGGTWSVQTLPVCRRKICPVLSAYDNTTISKRGVLCGEETVFKCKKGYSRHSGSYSMRCGIRGWRGTQLKCTATNCPTLIIPKHATLSTKSTQIGVTVSMSCAECHRVEQTKEKTSISVTCSSSGLWSESLPTCAKVHCPVSDPHPGVIISGMNTHCRGKALYKCAPGLDLMTGDLNRTCQEDGTWTGSEPVCAVQKCPTISKSPHVEYTTFNNTIGTILSFKLRMNSCYGYQTLDGYINQKSIYCKNDGKWNDSVTSPTKVQCPSLNPPENVHIVSHKTGCNEETTFKCAENTTVIKGSLTTWCLRNGSWSHPFPICREIKLNTEKEEIINPNSGSRQQGDPDNNFMIVCAVSGWILFIIACVVCGLYILRIQKERDLQIAQLRRQGISPHFARQTTDTTTISEI